MLLLPMKLPIRIPMAIDPPAACEAALCGKFAHS
jgi:hypothetical protein